MRHLLLPLIAAAAALPFLASCSATVAPDGYSNSGTYYSPAPTYYSTAPNYYYAPYPRYHEYHPYVYHHDVEHRHVVVEHHDDHDADIHGHIAIER